MENFKQLSAHLLFVIFMTTMLVSCGNSNDEPHATETRPTLISCEGKDLFIFIYDDSGKLTHLSSSALNFTININYSPLQLIISDGKDISTLNNISTTHHGFIQWATCYDKNGSRILELTYNQSGNLTRISDTNGEDIIFTWSDGNLIELKKYSGDGSESTCTFNYSDIANKNGIFSPCWGPYGSVLMSGLFGLAPKYFPSGIKFYNGETADYAYKLNDDGTINTEQITYHGHTSNLSYKYQPR